MSENSLAVSIYGLWQITLLFYLTFHCSCASTLSRHTGMDFSISNATSSNHPPADLLLLQMVKLGDTTSISVADLNNAQKESATLVLV